MEAFAVAAACVSLATNCTKIAKNLYIYVKETKDADQTLSGLLDEVK
jgi:hypothetical protein